MRIKCPPPEVLEWIDRHLTYTPATGIIRWQNLTPKMKCKATEGEPAGWLATDGYLKVSIKDNTGKRRHLACHHIAYYLMHKEWPAGLGIDHSNRKRRDNRAKNIRVTTTDINRVNRSLNSNSTTGVRGVSMKLDKFLAYICYDWQSYHLGVFDTLAEARAARIAGERLLFKKLCPTNDKRSG